MTQLTISKGRIPLLTAFLHCSQCQRQGQTDAPGCLQRAFACGWGKGTPPSSGAVPLNRPRSLSGQSSTEPLNVGVLVDVRRVSPVSLSAGSS